MTVSEPIDTPVASPAPASPALSSPRDPEELPDLPREGRPSPEAAARAVVQKPQIGDTRPAPPVPLVPDDDATAAKPRRRRRRGGRGRGGGGGGQASTLVREEADEVFDPRRRGRERKGRPV